MLSRKSSSRPGVLHLAGLHREQAGDDLEVVLDPVMDLPQQDALLFERGPDLDRPFADLPFQVPGRPLFGHQLQRGIAEQEKGGARQKEEPPALGQGSGDGDLGRRDGVAPSAQGVGAPQPEDEPPGGQIGVSDHALGGRARIAPTGVETLQPVTVEDGGLVHEGDGPEFEFQVIAVGG